MATARLELKLDSTVKSRIAKASALEGVSTLTQYVIKVMDEAATKVIEQHETMKLEGDIFDKFFAACDNAAAPNEALVAAKLFTTEQGIK